MTYLWHSDKDINSHRALGSALRRIAADNAHILRSFVWHCILKEFSSMVHDKGMPLHHPYL